MEKVPAQSAVSTLLLVTPGLYNLSHPSPLPLHSSHPMDMHDKKTLAGRLAQIGIGFVVAGFLVPGT